MHIIETAIEFWPSRISGAKNVTKLPSKHTENIPHNCLHFTDSRLLKKSGTNYHFTKEEMVAVCTYVDSIVCTLMLQIG